MNASELQIIDGWFRDAERRYVLLRGVNFGGRSKLPPYLPIFPVDHTTLASFDEFAAALAAVEADLDGLAEIGCNVVRLLVMWKALEREPRKDGAGLDDDARLYVRCLRALLDSLARRGILAIIDFHQDLAHERFCGDGFPDWAIAEEGPALPKQDPPDPYWNGRYECNSKVKETLTSFWNNSTTNRPNRPNPLVNFPTRDHLIGTIELVARELADHQAVLGYEPFNEPDEANIDVETFETGTLPLFYNAAFDAIARAHPSALVFVEPRVDWTTYGKNLKVPVIGFTEEPATRLALDKLPKERAVFSFHHYDPWTIFLADADAASYHLYPGRESMKNKAREWPRAFELMKRAAGDLVPFLTELGADNRWDRFGSDVDVHAYHRKQTRAYMDIQFQQVEAFLLNATYWQVDFSAKSDKDGDHWNEEQFSLYADGRDRNVDIFSRPYPMRSSARPVHLAFDLQTERFVLVLTGVPCDAPTLVFVPTLHHYGDGFRARASGGALAWNPVDRILVWTPNATATVHALVIQGALDVEVEPPPEFAAPPLSISLDVP